MIFDDRRNDLEHIMRRCPDILTPIKAACWSPLGKNTIYSLIKSGDLRSFRYKGGYIISKDDLINYLLSHADDVSDKAIFHKEVRNNDKD